MGWMRWREVVEGLWQFGTLVVIGVMVWATVVIGAFALVVLEDVAGARRR
jgi:hypothetical protein